MPHVIVKLWPGRSEEQKRAMAAKVTAVIKETLGATDDYISVGVEEITSGEWPKAVYKPDIVDKADTLYKKPGYGYSDEELGI